VPYITAGQTIDQPHLLAPSWYKLKQPLTKWNKTIKSKTNHDLCRWVIKCYNCVCLHTFNL